MPTNHRAYPYVDRNTAPDFPTQMNKLLDTLDADVDRVADAAAAASANATAVENSAVAKAETVAYTTATAVTSAARGEFTTELGRQDETLEGYAARLGAVETLGGLAPGDTSDAAVANALANPASSSAAVLADVVGDRLAPVDQAHIPPLAHIARATTGPFRIMLTGTSIANNSNSAVKTMAEWLRTQYGDSGAVINVTGGAGGSYTNTIDGWTKQYYGGPMTVRLRGTSAATAPFSRDLNGNGDRLVVEWSREADTGTSEVLVDGVAVGTIGAAGAQAYAQRTEFTITPGPHRVQINPPASGVTYLELVEIVDSTRKGVEVRDATLGGSSIHDMYTVRAAETGQTPGVPIVGDAGIRAHFDRPDVDLHIVEHTMNDSGRGMGWATGGFRTGVDAMVNYTRARGVPLVLIVEMAGAASMAGGNHDAYMALRDYLLAQRVHNHVTVIDWHGATVLSDIHAYAARYYNGVTVTNEATRTYSGDFVHPNKTAYRVLENMLARVLPSSPPRRELPSQIELDRLRTTPAGGNDRRALVAGAVKRYAVPSGPTYLARSAGKGSYFQGRVAHYYRDSTAANHASPLASSIDSSTTSDAYGKYKEGSNQVVYLTSGHADWVNGERAMLTVRASGTVQFRADNAVSFYADGVLIPDTDTANNRTLLTYLVGTGVEPVVFTVQVGTSALNQNLYVTGRLYEIAVTRSDVPLLV